MKILLQIPVNNRIQNLVVNGKPIVSGILFFMKNIQVWLNKSLEDLEEEKLASAAYLKHLNSLPDESK